MVVVVVVVVVVAMSMAKAVPPIAQRLCRDVNCGPRQPIEAPIEADAHLRPL
jgi:hypothetical protein